MIPINKKIKFPWDKVTLTGTREELLKKMKKLADPGCRKCYGRGYIGFKEKLVRNIPQGNKIVNVRNYIPCSKCIEKNIIKI